MLEHDHDRAYRVRSVPAFAPISSRTTEPPMKPMADPVVAEFAPEVVAEMGVPPVGVARIVKASEALTRPLMFLRRVTVGR